MKKLILIILSLFLVTGCNDNNTNNEINNNENNKNNENNQKNEQLKDPIIEWCQLYNPNGFNTITCVMSNPNKVDIDVTYDLVFYKDEKEVARQEAWSNFQVSPKHNDVIWGNVDIPRASDVDEVKMENIIVSKAYNKSIDAEIKYIETIEDKAYFSVNSKTKPTVNDVWILLYNDKNKNKKCDKGELVITELHSILEKETKISVDTDVVSSVYGIDYNEYEIYYNAY